MPGLLQNHIAVVTGAASGIGRAIALGYAREGAQVVLLDMNEKSVAKLRRKSAMPAARPKASCSMSQSARIASRSPSGSPSKVGQVSILVNNAGIARRNGMLGAAEAVINDWEDIIAINLTGVFNVTHAFLARFAPPRAASSISARSSRSCICARRVRRPIPPPSMACSASPRRWPPNSARTASASMRSAPASSKPR